MEQNKYVVFSDDDLIDLIEESSKLSGMYGWGYEGAVYEIMRHATKAQKKERFVLDASNQNARLAMEIFQCLERGDKVKMQSIAELIGK